MTSRAARVLILDDDAGEVERLEGELSRLGLKLDIRRCATLGSLERELASLEPDVIVAAYRLPTLPGLAALRLCRGAAPETPVIFVASGQGEERAIEALREGAADWIAGARLERLAPSVLRALRDREDAAGFKRLQKELELTRARESFILRSMPLALYTARAEPERPFTWISEQALRLTGFPPERFVSDPGFWASRLHPDDWPRVIRELERPGPGGRLALEYRWRVFDGSFRWFLDQAATTAGLPGQPSEVLGSWLDVTERKELEGGVVQAQKMEALGQLAGGVAHDFNNILLAISGHAHLVLGELPEGSPARADVEQIRKVAERAAGLTRQLLAFSRKGPLEPAVIDPNAVLKESALLLTRVLGEHIRLAVEPGPSVCKVKADPSQLQQIILNLAVNGRDAMPEGGRLTVRTGDADLGPEEAARAGVPGPGAYAVISVTDTGAGMTEEVRRHIFEPFFTTKGVGRGTGLGLSTVYGIVRQSGGGVHVETAPGRGTTFTVYLPRTEEPGGAPPEGAAPADAEAGAAAGGAGSAPVQTILLVEDEEIVRRMTQRLLERAGYRVIAAAGPEEALAAFEARGAEIALVLSDVVMPGMSGLEAAQRMEAWRPGTRFLFMSGHVHDGVAGKGLGLTDDNLLRKPFSPGELARRVRKALQRP